MTELVTTAAVSGDIAIAALSLPEASTLRVSHPTSNLTTAPVPPISTIVMNSSQQAMQPQTSGAVVSILEPPNPTPASLPLRTEQPKPFFLHRKLNPLPETAVHFAKSPQPFSDSGYSTLGARSRSLSQGSVFSAPIVHEQLRKTYTRGSDGSQPSTSSLERTEVTGRVVGRGGSGSRLRTVVSKHDVTPKIVSKEAHTTDSPPMPLRVNGRGGLASRPMHLSPAPASKSPDLQSSPASVVQVPRYEANSQLFIRPSGRGGAGSRPGNSVKKAQNPLALRDIINRTKRKPSKKDSPQNRVVSTLAHPISSTAAYEITNATDESLSSLHFAGESTSPPPTFFPQAAQEVTDASSEQYFTPPFSASSSTSDGSMSLRSTGEDDLDIDVYLEEQPTHVTDIQHHRSLSKLMRTFGVNPYDSTTTPDSVAAPVQPKISVAQQRSLNDRTVKVIRRASLSMNSIFSRPSRRQGSSGLDSQESITTITDDLHQLGLQNDTVSESWGYLDASRLSASEPPGSPIVFSPPSPPPQKSTLPVDGADDEISVPTSTLPLESHTPTRAIYTGKHSRSHGRSLSSSLSEIAFADSRSDVIATADWIFPPSESDHDFKLSVSRNLSDKPMPWTGEWNTDMDDVISALRQLR